MKKRLSNRLIALIVIMDLIIAVVCLTYFAPGLVFDGAQKGTRFVAGLSSKSIEVDGYTYRYLESKKNQDLPLLVLLHGFTADKDSWARMSVFLKGKYHIIAFDALGHGESSKPMDAKYDGLSQAQRLHSIVEKMQLKKFHLAGNSMGGYVAGVYAATYPQGVESVIFLDNAGIDTKEKSELMLRYEKTGQNSLILTSDEQADEYFDSVFSKAPFMPSTVKKYYARGLVDHHDLFTHIFNDFAMKQFPNIEPYLPNIQVPTLIVWGAKDKVLHVSSADVMQTKLKDVKVVKMPGIGHAPMLEAPKETANIIHTFITTVQG